MTGRDAARERALDALQLGALRGGDASAFAALVQRRSGRLYAHARRLTDDAETARDLVQEAWVEIWRGLRGLRDDLAFLPWALRIVSRGAARDLHRRQGGRGLAADLAVLHPEAAGPADGALVREALAQLTPADRALIALYALEDMSHAELAVALDIPVGTVKSRLHAARKRLHAYLEGDGDGKAG